MTSWSKTRKPWHEHAAWLVIDVADALRPLVGKATHLCLSPDMILVDTDRKGYYRPLPIDLGLVLSKVEREEPQSFWLQFSNPAYTPPELIALEKKLVSVPPGLRRLLPGHAAARDAGRAADFRLQIGPRRRGQRGRPQASRRAQPQTARSCLKKPAPLSKKPWRFRLPSASQISTSFPPPCARCLAGRQKSPCHRPVGQWVVLILALPPDAGAGRYPRRFCPDTCAGTGVGLGRSPPKTKSAPIQRGALYLVSKDATRRPDRSRGRS